MMKNGGFLKKLFALFLAFALILGVATTFTSCTEDDINNTIKIIDDILDETEPPETDAPETKSPTKKPKATSTPKATATPKPTATPKIDFNGRFDDRDNVALYIKTYGVLPQNYMTKAEAEKKGWTGGSLDRVVKGYAIGGDTFGNYEKRLPTGVKYKECDIDTIGTNSRGTKRIIFTKNHIYYTDDHYVTFVEYMEDGTWK